MTDGLQAVGMPQLLQGRDARLRGGPELLAGRRQARTHRVELRRQLADLVPLPENERAREVSFADATRLLAERLHRTTDEPEAEGEGDPRAQHDHERRRRDDLELGRRMK